MNPWLSAIIGFAFGQAVLILVLWFGHKLSAYKGRHEESRNA